MVVGGSLIGQLVLIALVILSSLSWAIIVLKWLQFRKIQKENDDFMGVFHGEPRLDQIYNQTSRFKRSPLAYIFKNIYWEVSQIRKKIQQGNSQKVSPTENLSFINQHVDRVLEQTFSHQTLLIENRINLLATVASASPFIGLFGTVLGIIDSFQNIGVSGVTSLASVAPGISEALVATAAGLLAAIPALIAFNIFRNYSRNLGNSMRDFSLELTNRIEWVLYERFTLARERAAE